MYSQWVKARRAYQLGAVCDETRQQDAFVDVGRVEFEFGESGVASDQHADQHALARRTLHSSTMPLPINQSINLLKVNRLNGHLHRSNIHDIQTLDINRGLAKPT